MLRFHANVFASPPAAVAGPSVTLRGADVSTLRAETGGPPLFTEPLPASFEEIQRRLAELPRCDFEPDGFFLLTGREAGAFWRLSGHLHEYDGRMHRVELNGECPHDSLSQLLGVFGGDACELVFELVREGVTLNDVDFFDYAAGVDTTGLSRDSR